MGIKKRLEGKGEVVEEEELMMEIGKEKRKE